MAADAGEYTAAGGPEEVKPYSLHVSSRYLDLTREKLELVRLPHESSHPPSQQWWEPKPEVEPLIDFWLEQYSWRDQEELLNSQLPQFRTSFTTPSSDKPVRIHFVHVRSPRPDAVPLLLIPPFPFSNLSFQHLVHHFTCPEEDESNDGAGPASTSHADGYGKQQKQAFHLVIPALPGLGFSDALPNNTPVIPVVAGMLNTLMVARLSYPHYLMTNAGCGTASPAAIDSRLAHYLAATYSDSCLGSHLISPPLARPRARDAPLEWAKYTLATLLRAPIFGYSKEDLSALRRSDNDHNSQSVLPLKSRAKQATTPKPAQAGLNELGALREPNSLAYALCDSPTGLLVLVVRTLRLLGGGSHGLVLSPTDIINLTQLAWLPGPEAAMRLWAYCAQHQDEVDTEPPTFKSLWRQKRKRPTVAITVFLGDEDGAQGKENRGEERPQTQNEAGAQEGAATADGQTQATHRNDNDAEAPSSPSDQPQYRHESQQRLPGYACPSWADQRYNVVHVQRANGRAGLLAWERPELIVAGVRGLAEGLIRAGDGQLLVSRTTSAATDGEESPAQAPLTQVVVGDADTGGVHKKADDGGSDNNNGGEATSAPGASSGPSPPSASLLAPPKDEERDGPHRQVSDDTTAVASSSGASVLPPPSTKAPSPAAVPDETTGANHGGDEDGDDANRAETKKESD